MPTVFDEIRTAAAVVAEQSSQTHIDEDAVERLADRLASAPPPAAFPEELATGTPAEIVAATLTWNAVNYGSGWFPVVRKLAGRSGSRTFMTLFHRHVAAHGTWSPKRLAEVSADDAAALFDQEVDGPAGELMALFAESWRQLGSWLLTRYGGSFVGAVEAAGGSAAALLGALVEMPHYADVHRYGLLTVPLYKRAQITASDLHHSLGGVGPGRFDDLGQLTLFADNLVPHVLRMAGVLRHASELAGRIERGELLTSGEPAEVELRACAVHAVELLVASLVRRGLPTTAADADHRLWRMGQAHDVKAVPRHRCRCTFY
jgi:hypothetical protein